MFDYYQSRTLQGSGQRVHGMAGGEGPEAAAKGGVSGPGLADLAEIERVNSHKGTGVAAEQVGAAVEGESRGHWAARQPQQSAAECDSHQLVSTPG